MNGLSHIAIVMYQPQDVVNVAAVIRVMSNFGLSDLRLVEPAAFDPYRIEGIAHHTGALIAATRRFPTLAEAVADCSLMLGTTGRPRRGDRLVLSPRLAAPFLLQAVQTAPTGRRVAVLFGPEQDGLPNEALDRCHGVLTIPTAPENRSLNLAQAALVVCYELFMAVTATDAPSPAPPVAAAPDPGLAPGQELEAMFAAVQGLLEALYPSTADTRLQNAMSRLRTMLMRAAPRSEEALALTNLCRHAARALRTGPSITDH